MPRLVFNLTGGGMQKPHTSASGMWHAKTARLLYLCCIAQSTSETAPMNVIFFLPFFALLSAALTVIVADLLSPSLGDRKSEKRAVEDQKADVVAS
jgi:hypothetical protein